jgi:hypothetical protein
MIMHLAIPIDKTGERFFNSLNDRVERPHTPPLRAWEARHNVS